MSRPSPWLAGVFSGFNDRLAVGLGLTQTIGYGTLYYAYGVVVPAIAREFGFGLDMFFAAFTFGLLLGGLVAPVVGRTLDRRGARIVMVGGSAFAALALAFCAWAPNIWLFLAAVVLIEIAGCLVLYEAAFAAVVQARGVEARQAITVITLFAGFASTIFWPLTQALLDLLGWRGTFLTFGLMHLVFCVPLHWVLIKPAAAYDAIPTVVAHRAVVAVLQGAVRRRALVLYGAAVVISGIVTSAFPVHMLRIIEHEGFTPQTAALIAMLMGPAQVLARFLDMVYGSRLDALATGRAALGLLVASVVCLLACPPGFIAAAVFAACYGAAQGLITIARATVPLQLFGSAGYATLVGRITGIRLLGNAASPLLFALGMTHLGMDATLLTSAAAAAIALVCFLALRAPTER